MQSLFTDLNNAKPQGSFDLIPKETIAKAVVWLREGNHGEANELYKSASGAIGLKVDFVIDEGAYKNRTISQLIGIKGIKTAKSGDDIWGNMGRSFMRGIIESAYNIQPRDESEAAKEKRKLKSFKDLNGLKCLVKIGIWVDQTKKYNDQNKVTDIITPNRQEYNRFMSSADIATKPFTQNNINSNDVRNDFDDDIPF